MKYLTLKILFVLLLLTSCNKYESKKVYSRTWTDADKLYLKINLESSLDSILNVTKNLSEGQFNWRSSEEKWSIAHVLEHLITHDELFYREARVLTGLVEMMQQKASHFELDEGILSYSKVTSTNIGKSPSYLEPLGRWCSKQDAVNAYKLTRERLIEFVEISDKDLRKYYTTSGRGATKYRDLHQLLLISIAHTKRHLEQIQKIKGEINFPPKS